VTGAEAIAAAQRLAADLGWPWNPASVSVVRRRVWPLRAYWQVESRSAAPAAVTTFRVGERDGVAYPVRVVYPRSNPSASPGLQRLSVRHLLAACAGALTGFIISRALLGWPLWLALPLSLAGALVAPAVLLSARRPPGP
jgi:hypothetical protein